MKKETNIFHKLVTLFKATVMFSLFSMMFFVFFILISQRIEFQDDSLFFAGTQQEITEHFTTAQISQTQNAKISSFGFYLFYKKQISLNSQKLQLSVKEYFSNLFSREISEQPFKPPIFNI
jgi:hypothetical protein